MEADGSMARLRVLRLLASGSAACGPCARDLRLRLESDRIGAVSVERGAFDALRSEGLIVVDEGVARLTRAGKTRYRSMRAQASEGMARQDDIAFVQTMTPSGRQCIAVNIAESPLSQLARRRRRNGDAFLSQAEFDAGERLRADYTRGMMMPRVSANWETPIASKRRGGVSGDRAELTHSALTARGRVDAALKAVGPELSGVLVDICCFLKGLETVEVERRWPARSAKVVLKTALAALARHYAPPPNSRERGPLHWGSEDYRPSIAS